MTLSWPSALRMIFTIMVGCFCARICLAADDGITEKLVQTFIMEFVEITPGIGVFPAEFEQGSNDGDTSEKPVHVVKMTAPFAMARYEVPQNLYAAVVGSNPSRWKGPRNSVEMMTWNEANAFCRKVAELARTQKLIAEDETIRLPTEAEWEYCCRAGTTTRYSFGDDAQKDGDVAPKASRLSEFAWHTGNAAGNDPPVGALKPNPWGLYDMHGYLWELTADAWTADYREAAAEGVNSKPAAVENAVVIRSGSWKDGFEKLTSSTRRQFSKLGKDDAVGFRCVKSKAVK